MIVVRPTMSRSVDRWKHGHVTFTTIEWWTSHAQRLKVTARSPCIIGMMHHALFQVGHSTVQPCLRMQCGSLFSFLA